MMAEAFVRQPLFLKESSDKGHFGSVFFGDASVEDHAADVDGRPDDAGQEEVQEESQVGEEESVHEIHGDAHDGGGDDVFQDDFDVDDVADFTVNEEHVEDGGDADVGHRRIGSPGDAQGRDGDQEPVAQDLGDTSDGHVDDRNLRLLQPLEDGRRNLVQPQEADGDGHSPRRFRSGRCIVDEGDDRFGHDVEDDAERNGDQEGNAHGRRRPFADFIVFLQGEAVADGRYQAHGHGSRQDGSQIDERYGHAR